MGDAWFAWLLGLPVGGAVVASLLIYFGRRVKSTSSRARLEVAALGCVSAGLLLAMMVTLGGQEGTLVAGAGFEFSPLTRLMLFVINISLLCALFGGWSRAAGPERKVSLWTIPVTSSLLAAALLAQDGLISILFLLGAALVVAASACVIPTGVFQDVPEGEAPITAGKRVAGGLKHLSIAVIGTGLLVVAVLLLSRYGLNLENRGLLQLGVGLLSIGLLVRAGAMPFANAASDLVDAAPMPAMNLFGAVTPAVLLVGLLLLLPVERTLLAGNSTAWVGAITVLLAGVRAVGVRLPGRYSSAHDNVTLPIPGELVSATIAVQIGWALTGLLLAYEAGAAGALLLAVNLSLAVPLTILSASRAAGGSRFFRVGLAVGVASLLGLPPLGGFTGTLLIAQATANLGGFWVAIMLLGSMLVAAKWLALTRAMPTQGEQSSPSTPLQTDLILVSVLTLVQFGLLALTSPMAEIVAALASPWLQ